MACHQPDFLYPAFLVLWHLRGRAHDGGHHACGAIFGARSAAPLTFLNFSWSAGALLAPLLAARLLAHSTVSQRLLDSRRRRSVGCAGMPDVLEKHPGTSPAVPVKLADAEPALHRAVCVPYFSRGGGREYVGIVAGDAMFCARREPGLHVAAAAHRSTGVDFWHRADCPRCCCCARRRRACCASLSSCGTGGSGPLLGLSGTALTWLRWSILGAALAPIFPLLLARFFARRGFSDSRWVLSLCGFGGSVLPWMAGLLSAHSGSLRVGLMVIPAALLVMVLLVAGARSEAATAVADSV